MLLVFVLPSIWIDSTLNFSLSSIWYSRSMLLVVRLGLRGRRGRGCRGSRPCRSSPRGARRPCRSWTGAKTAPGFARGRDAAAGGAVECSLLPVIVISPIWYWRPSLTDGDDEPVRLGVVEDDLVLGDLDVEVAVLPVVVAQLVEVVLEVVVLEAAGVGQPGKHPPLLGVHLAAQRLGLDVGVADEKLMARIFTLLPSRILKMIVPKPVAAVAVDRVGDRDLVVALPSGSIP